MNFRQWRDSPPLDVHCFRSVLAREWHGHSSAYRVPDLAENSVNSHLTEDTVYLLHFERTYYGQMRHYAWFTADDLG
jgi:hypothetical protein